MGLGLEALNAALSRAEATDFHVTRGSGDKVQAECLMLGIAIINCTIPLIRITINKWVVYVHHQKWMVYDIAIPTLVLVYK